MKPENLPAEIYRNVRNKALEDAAIMAQHVGKVFDEESLGLDIAEAIRQLKRDE